MLIVILSLVGYFLGMVATLVCLKCAESEFINNFDDMLDCLPVIFWPVTILVYTIYFVYKFANRAATQIIAAICPNKE